ncbi:hypothetical protein PC116_g2336 [Phytophthora cactorum]|uniref:Uncharacterized protein n=1 Tax=Phytophthora cactorum TaxID=29920 RepID=A0A8T1LK57_9STRA|nr:hypothetical protein Pcac1_g6490 [Phytophthora cactorum]KAG2890978.1 hypothetical protein PC114_g17193 [Phytophthora cactorum]KAG2945345.1 hypothetical protein PC117_g8549 [Phytophthora cactorum]KAG3001055.1 hypothetical protein PC119_g16868 [Phytophthora cactorum]KAG3147225.1 hypothetical protein C6341_g17839 [Phytophthora cactorum]
MEVTQLVVADLASKLRAKQLLDVHRNINEIINLAPIEVVLHPSTKLEIVALRSSWLRATMIDLTAAGIVPRLSTLI